MDLKCLKSLPTIDFDSSSSDNEEVITVFQRPAALSLKLLEDFDSLSTEEAEMEKWLTLETQTHTSGETCSHSLKLGDDDDDDETGGGNTVAQRVTGHCDGDAESLDQWDLDSVLQNLKDHEMHLRQYLPAEPAETDEDGDKCRSPDIMERLVAFCTNQSSKSVSEPVKRSDCIKQNNTWNKPLERMAEELQLSHQECPTVSIDLRCPDPSIKSPRTFPNLPSESKTPAKHYTHQEAPPVNKSDLKVHPESRMGDREATGKTLLLQKIREMNGNGNKYHSECRDPPESVRGNEAGEMKDSSPQL